MAEGALSSSENSDQKFLTLNSDYSSLLEQNKIDNAQRMSDLTNWQTISETLSLRVGTLQTFSDDLLKQLGIFSGSEDEKHAKAMVALGHIQDGVKAVELENKILKIGGSVLLVAAVVIGGYEGGKALRWW
jgi:hypothetical protein